MFIGLMKNFEENSLRTPAVDNPGQENLLWVIRYEWAKREDGTAKVSIRTLENDGRRHSRTKRFKDVGECGMIELLAKDFPIFVVLILTTGWSEESLNIEKMKLMK